VLAATALAAAGRGAAAPTPPPRLEVAETVHDFGTVPPGQKLVHDFRLRNAGAVELVIDEVRPHCTCTAVEFDRTIAPGGTGRVRVEVDTATLLGSLRKSVDVFAGGRPDPLVSLTVRGYLQPHVSLHPGLARFVAVAAGPAVTSSQIVWSNDFDDFQVLAARSPYPYLRAAITEIDASERHPERGRRQWRVDLTLLPEAPPGPLGDFVVLDTNHPAEATVRVPIGGFVRPAS
jgi:hypothetical protein